MKFFSPLGYVLFTMWGLALALSLEGWRLVALVALQLVFGLTWSREGLRPLYRLRFWVFMLTAVALGPLLAREPGLSREGLASTWLGALSPLGAGLWMGLGMAGRALALTLSFSLGLSVLSVSDLVAMFDRLHLRGLGFSLGVAMNLLDTLQEMSTVTYHTIKLRGGLRRPVLALRLFLVTVLSNAMRYGDQVVNAARVRAFEPNSHRYSPPYPEGLFRRADLRLCLALAVSAFLLLCIAGQPRAW
jgi:energy-coupling factor transporter transmembrane protein EcfT